MEVNFLTSHVAVRYMQVCTADVVRELCPVKKAFPDSSGLETWRES